MDDTTETRRAIEAICMVSDQPVEPSVLAQLLEIPKAQVETICEELAAEYVAENRGFVLARVAGGYRYQTHPDTAPYVERFVLEGQSSRLSAAALETLAIVAYKQPISRLQIAAIRGVNVDGVMRTLQQRGYVDESGRDPGPGNAVLFATTALFLERVGLDSVDDLPPLAEFVPGADVVEALEEGLRPHELDPDMVLADDTADADEPDDATDDAEGNAIDEAPDDAGPDPDHVEAVALASVDLTAQAEQTPALADHTDLAVDQPDELDDIDLTTDHDGHGAPGDEIDLTESAPVAEASVLDIAATAEPTAAPASPAPAYDGTPRPKAEPIIEITRPVHRSQFVAAAPPEPPGVREQSPFRPALGHDGAEETETMAGDLGTHQAGSETGDRSDAHDPAALETEA